VNAFARRQYKFLLKTRAFTVPTTITIRIVPFPAVVKAGRKPLAALFALRIHNCAVVRAERKSLAALFAPRCALAAPLCRRLARIKAIRGSTGTITQLTQIPL